jgi:meso-butanediol dehydrogenase / (S,S)-butanediol dehydrogenase / diacetyl reductase
VTDMTLADTIVLVTGAGAGIGAAIATELAARGAQVAVTDIDASAAKAVAESIRAKGNHASPYQLDVTDADAIAAVAERVEAEVGPLNAWVSNAGVSSMARFVDISEADLQLMLDVNTKGVFLCGQVAARHLAANGGGRIVNIASMAGKKGAAPFLAHYVASKFAVVGLTQSMAAELAPDGITVNSVCPGFVATPMQQRELEWEGALRGQPPETVRQMWIDDTPLGRIETPEDVAKPVAFLLSDDAAFITGEALAVNGGAHMD